MPGRAEGEVRPTQRYAHHATQAYNLRRVLTPIMIRISRIALIYATNLEQVLLLFS